MAPRRRPIYADENSSSDEFNDSDFQPLHKRSKRFTNMADEIPQEGVKRRGRGPSKRPCLNRNAQMARENRQKKKEYIQKIEDRLLQLQQENKSLKTVLQQRNIDMKKLNADVLYLRSVLNNKSNITLLLKSMNLNLARIKKSKSEALSPVNEKDTFSDLESLNDELFTEDCKIKLEDGVKATSNDSYQLLAEAYRMNNNLSKNDEDQIPANKREEEKVDFSPITPVSLDGGKTGSNFDESDFNEFSNFASGTIFDDLSQLDEASNTLDLANDPLDESFFQGLNENSGICLHVNPNKVSLEFCSSCQMNSVNSVLE